MTAVLQQLKPAFRIESVATTNNGVSITWKDGHESFYHNLWLLDSCRSPKFFHRDTLSISSGHDVIEMPLNPTPEEVKLDREGNLDIIWGGDQTGHQSVFDASWLRVHCQNDPALKQRRKPQLWDSSVSVSHFDCYEVMNDDGVLLSFLNKIVDMGVAIIDDAPKNEESFRALIERVGPLRQRYHPTNVFAMDRSNKKAQAIQHSYQVGTLRNHTDVTAYDIPTGLQFLECILYENPDGDRQAYSTVIDGFKLAEVIKAENPWFFELLTTEYIPAGRKRLSVEEKLGEHESSARKYEWDAYRHNHVINLDENGEVYQIRYNHNTRIPLEVSYDKIHDLLAAYQRFSQLLQYPEYNAEFLLTPGQVLVVDNWRVLHGRTGIWNPNLQRILLGAYLEEESFRCRRRVLLGDKTGMSDLWLMGCSDRALEILADRHL
ncbi:MAG: taurine catabolism dioxygenase TauD [Okeania sp. SIO3B5]|uniref:TauD/TfdA family dioxygenase n=1 Tax=Okeania sp. SIO3B5 TaxID=2607811 RepID=UPI001400C289|nr:TauD/TfdA family dioxygenase [Okeania sp. SIO3B5]NEO53502.1 taurine catabolism dioxygenase TauD [Okeania sp. SIO3B5]